MTWLSDRSASLVLVLQKGMTEANRRRGAKTWGFADLWASQMKLNS